jgi:16S rRNA G966 N2-methylase RsmD
LIKRIYQHAVEEGWLAPGQTVLDPFAGVGCGAFDAMGAGFRYIGVELEPRFVALAKENLEYWRQRWGFIGATVLQGDSRNLHEVVEKADSCISSPPFLDARSDTTASVKGQTPTRHDPEAWGQTPGQLGTLPAGRLDACIFSPPYNLPMSQDHNGSRRGSETYGQESGNMGSMDSGSVDCAISSPPFSGTEQPCASQSQGLKDYHAFTRGQGTKRDKTHTGETPGQLSAMPLADCVLSSPPYADGCDQKGTDYHPDRMRGTRTGYLQKDQSRYGATEGQLADMAVSSPPWEAQLLNHHTREKYQALHEKLHRDGKGHGGSVGASIGQDYGEAEGQLGTTEGQTFWEAARQVLASTYALLRDGGHAIFVVKRYVRDGQIVEFSRDWVRLCESVGFELVHWHKAMLVETHTEQGLFGEPVTMYTRSKKSFFRRLAENRGSPRVDWEDVVCLRKRAAS